MSDRYDIYLTLEYLIFLDFDSATNIPKLIGKLNNAGLSAAIHYVEETKIVDYVHIYGEL